MMYSSDNKARKVRTIPTNKPVSKKIIAQNSLVNEIKFQLKTNIKNIQLNDKKLCQHKERCIVWSCNYTHPKLRKKECNCALSDCNKLHRNQAICKNPNHKDGCTMSHTITELNAKLKN